MEAGVQARAQGRSTHSVAGYAPGSATGFEIALNNGKGQKLIPRMAYKYSKDMSTELWRHNTASETMTQRSGAVERLTVKQR
jgi:hypothetical protein